MELNRVQDWPTKVFDFADRFLQRERHLPACRTRNNKYQDVQNVVAVCTVQCAQCNDCMKTTKENVCNVTSQNIGLPSPNNKNHLYGVRSVSITRHVLTVENIKYKHFSSLEH